LAELTSSEKTKEEERSKKQDEEGNKRKKTKGEKYWKGEKEKKHRSKRQQTSKVINILGKHLHNIVVSLSVLLQAQWLSQKW